MQPLSIPKYQARKSKASYITLLLCLSAFVIAGFLFHVTSINPKTSVLRPNSATATLRIIKTAKSTKHLLQHTNQLQVPSNSPFSLPYFVVHARNELSLHLNDDFVITAVTLDHLLDQQEIDLLTKKGLFITEQKNHTIISSLQNETFTEQKQSILQGLYRYPRKNLQLLSEQGVQTGRLTKYGLVLSGSSSDRRNLPKFPITSTDGLLTNVPLTFDEYSSNLPFISLFSTSASSQLLRIWQRGEETEVLLAGEHNNPTVSTLTNSIHKSIQPTSLTTQALTLPDGSSVLELISKQNTDQGTSSIQSDAGNTFISTTTDTMQVDGTKTPKTLAISIISREQEAQPLENQPCKSGDYYLQLDLVKSFYLFNGQNALHPFSYIVFSPNKQVFCWNNQPVDKL